MCVCLCVHACASTLYIHSCSTVLALSIRGSINSQKCVCVCVCVFLCPNFNNLLYFVLKAPLPCVESRALDDNSSSGSMPSFFKREHEAIGQSLQLIIRGLQNSFFRPRINRAIMIVLIGYSPFDILAFAKSLGCCGTCVSLLCLVCWNMLQLVCVLYAKTKDYS